MSRFHGGNDRAGDKPDRPRTDGVNREVSVIDVGNLAAGLARETAR